MDSVIKLMTTMIAKNAQGVEVKSYDWREVFCRVADVSQAEFFEASKNGLSPSFTFLVFAADYRGESVAEYEGQTYAIYRTYRREDDYIRLYAERQVGVNGKQEG